MIGTFWNMCRACPSLPVDKLHSEYRSTYRWHEYTGPRQEIIRRPPQGSFTGDVQEPALPRRKKHPDLAYRTHRILTDSGSEALLDKTFLYDRARSEERWAASQEKNSRRSKSEGPPAGKPSFRVISKPIYSFIPNRSSKDRKTLLYDENEVPKTSLVFNNRSNIIQTEPLKSSPKRETPEIRIPYPRTAHVLQTRIDSQTPPKKSISMNGIKNKESNPEETVPVHRRAAGVKNKSELEVLQAIKTNPDSECNNTDESAHRYDDTDGEFKSEYKKNFQPFNRYDFDENKGVFEKRTVPLNQHNVTEVESPSSSWYKEVMLLRQKANQYRHRGWGTELVPDHIAQVYNDQIMLWEQVSRRSTLSALSLASTVLSRDASPSKEEKENRKNSPVKSLTRARSAKAATATHQGKTSDRKPGKTAATKTQPDSSPKKGNNQVKKLGIKRTSPSRTSREASVGTPPTIHKGLNEGVEKPKRRPRPSKTSKLISGNSTKKSVRTARARVSKPSRSFRFRGQNLNTGRHTIAADGHDSPNPPPRKRPTASDAFRIVAPRQPTASLISTVPSGSKTTQTKKKDKPDGEPEDFPTIDQEQIVKSPPEPTRVKSPEQIVIRSPEPVNWTVPLDTGKTFTVTQNIREGDITARSCSEAKPWALGGAPPPPASISAPTELLELAKTNIQGEILTK